MNKGITASNPSGVTSFSELFFMKEPHDVMAMRRDAVVLDCQAHGEAPIGIRWLKNGATITESERVYLLANSSLFIAEVDSRKDKSDEGTNMDLFSAREPA
ncbi:hypothetical protein M9458_035722 [Cirrhinus mrigala]|uniref:Ig-like domain-containing protein n=1 Tax=Cirrhinus mrigala TaxID=683832 RepID=A0ABD0P1S1_CIRMR